MKYRMKMTLAAIAMVVGLGNGIPQAMAQDAQDPVSYVNPYMGNISHLLVPTFPTIPAGPYRKCGDVLDGK